MIGAGIAGLSCARTLQDHDVRVSVFEAEEFPGGRASTLITDKGPFDAGAQYFTAGDERFAGVVRRWLADGVVDYWRGRIVAFNSGAIVDKSALVERFVAMPGMRRLGLHLAQGLDVAYRSPVVRIESAGPTWFLQVEGADTAAHGPFDVVCVALPSEAGVALLRGLSPIADAAATVRWDPCWAALLSLSQRSGAEFDGAFVNDDPILGWAARDSAKPRRGQVEGVAERWVLHAKPKWSRRYIDLPEADAARWIARSLSARLRRTLNPLSLKALRWLHATPLNPIAQRCLWDANRGLGMAGDWCDGPRIEGAYLSGCALAEAILDRD